MNSFRLSRLRVVHCLHVLLAVLVATLAMASTGLEAQAPATPRVTLQVLSAAAMQSQGAAVDLGEVPVSERASFVFTLVSSQSRSAALGRYLDELTLPGSPAYHHWLSPDAFAARFGATEAELALATAWLEAQGFAVAAVSPSHQRIAASGFTAQVERAFGVSLHRYQIAGRLYTAPTAQPSLPAEAATMFSGVDGLSDLPADALVSATTGRPVAFMDLAALIDANRTPVVSLDTVPSAAVSTGTAAEYAALFRQAAAQGITTLARVGVIGASADVTAVALPGEAAPALEPLAARPDWQNAPGLPEDALRHAPDLTASSMAEFAEIVSGLNRTDRLGNLGRTLYSLAPTAGLYTQPDGAQAIWEPSTGLGLVDLAVLARVFPHGTTPASVQVSLSTGSPVHGQSFTLTVVVTGQNGAVPTGTVMFSSAQPGFTAASVVLDASGRATSPAYLVPGGPYTVTAAYAGDGTYAGASATTQFSVQPEPAIFTLAAPASASLGNTFAATAKLVSASGFGTPAAMVTVTPSGIANVAAATQTLAGSGATVSASFSFTTNKAGTVSLQAACTPSDASFTCFTPQTATVTVPPAVSTTTLSILPATPTAGVPVVFTALVTGIAGIVPTGTVTFLDGSTSLGTGTAPNATFTGTLAPGVSHSLTAVYAGDTNYNTSTSAALNPSVGTASTTTSVMASASTIGFGQTVTVNVTVKGSTTVNGTQPTGTLAYTLSGPSTTTSATASITGGAVSIPFASLPVGTYTLATTYQGDASYAASTGNTVSFTITQAAAMLSAQLSSTAFTTGSTSTVTATVQLPGNAQLPAGSTFSAAVANSASTTIATYPGTFTINAGGNSGTGAVTVLAPPAGSYTVVVTCAANASFTCNTVTTAVTSTAAATTGTVATTTVLSLNPAVPSAGSPVTLTATVTAGPTSTTPLTGTVTFLDGTTRLGTGTLSAGIATLSTTLTGTTAGHSLTAVYSGDTIYAASTSPAVAVTVATAPSAIVLSSSTSNTLAGQAVTLTARVTGVTATGLIPTGTVNFYVAGATPRLLGTAGLGTAGAGLAIATLTTTAIPAGSQTIYAVYAGDANFSSVTSNSLTIGLGDYTVTFVPQSLTLTRGQTGQATMILGIVNGFAGTVILGCTPTPNTLITCTVTPPVLVGGGSSTLTIVTTAPKTGRLAVPGAHRGAVAGGLALAGLLCLLLPRRRDRLPALLLLLAMLGLGLNMGCGSGVADPTLASGGTPLGTTTVTIATAGSDGVSSVRHDYTYQVSIQ